MKQSAICGRIRSQTCVLSRSKLATWASIGLTAVLVLGWIVEAAVKWVWHGRSRTSGKVRRVRKALVKGRQRRVVL
jgi:hypothetical protein